MNLAGAVTSFAQEVTLTRTAAGDYFDGRYVPGATSESVRQMVVVPASSRDLQVLPEGLRTEQTMVFMDTEELRTAEAGGAPADRIAFGGKTFELQHVDDWSSQGGYWRAVGVKVGQ